MKRRKGIVAIVALVVVFCFAFSAYADKGPKPPTQVEVINAPLDVNVTNGPLEVVIAAPDCSSSPTITAGFNPPSPIVGDSVIFYLSAADPEGQDITIKSEFVEMPPFSVTILTPTVGSTPAFYPDVPGYYIIRSTVTNEMGCSTSLETVISVSQAP